MTDFYFSRIFQVEDDMHLSPTERRAFGAGPGRPGPWGVAEEIWYLEREAVDPDDLPVGMSEKARSYKIHKFVDNDPLDDLFCVEFKWQVRDSGPFILSPLRVYLRGRGQSPQEMHDAARAKLASSMPELVGRLERAQRT